MTSPCVGSALADTSGTWRHDVASPVPGVTLQVPLEPVTVCQAGLAHRDDTPPPPPCHAVSVGGGVDVDPGAVMSVPPTPVT